MGGRFFPSLVEKPLASGNGTAISESLPPPYHIDRVFLPQSPSVLRAPYYFQLYHSQYGHKDSGKVISFAKI
jgi:hypothetical protein